MTLDERLVQIRPSARQLRTQALEFYAFAHYGMNTYTDREWGDGTEDPQWFNPTAFDPKQWTDAIQGAGMRGLILTCKHHDGFCLWPSAYTKHSVASSPYKGDIVREVSDACREAGLAFGVYLSPWDRNHPAYGSGKAYDDYFIAQLTELLTNYGEIFSVWLDGACGEGPNGKKQTYDFPRYFETVRKLQPNACIHICGPDIRWCGNEAGKTRESEWSVVPTRTCDTEIVQHLSQKSNADAARLREIRASDRDLGSRAILADEPELIWYPAEVDTSIRPGWFYHASEDDKVRPLDELLSIYHGAVGGNAMLLLNLPPNKEGRIHENDVARLRELGDAIRKETAVNLLNTAALTATGGQNAEAVRAADLGTYFAADGPQMTLEARWNAPVSIGCVVLQEHTAHSQRVERFVIEAELAGETKTVFEGTVVGHKRIVTLPSVQADAIRVKITDARVAAEIAFWGVYKS